MPSLRISVTAVVDVGLDIAACTVVLIYEIVISDLKLLQLLTFLRAPLCSIAFDLH
jgi:hypothetical protein